MDFYLMAWKNFADLYGRSRRSEYWGFTLLHAAITMALFLSATFAGQSANALWGVAWLYSIAGMLPAVSVSVRRLHDIGKSSWWMLLAFIPLGAFVLLAFLSIDSEPGPNRYGPSPKVEAPSLVAG